MTTFRLGHISDLHVFALESRDPRRFLNKRLIGGLNLLLHRRRSHSSAAVARAIEALNELGVDHLAITGDLSNLGLKEEFLAARRAIESSSLDAEAVSVVPGNHDYYTRAALRGGFERVFAAHQTSDLPAYQGEGGYPFCRLRDGVALIGLNSALPSRPFYAIGTVGPAQRGALADLLADPALRGRAVVVMIHHPLLPFEHSRVEYTRRLTDAHQTLSILRWANVDVAIHGHNHYFHALELPHLGAPGTLRIYEAGSVSVTDATDPMFGGKFNIYHFEGGALRKVETHLFEASDETFREWRVQELAPRAL